ncbi:MAG TPA: NAD-dependent protein deacylase [Holophaga sp.]|nr:NAD-dependent protein deacylase [Holophaga sp.]
MHIAPKSFIVVLTGAGISAESGLSTFRASDGLWEQHRVEDVATPEGFARDPELVHRFYNARRRQLRDVEANAAHQALARLEHAWPGGVLVVTQNVDDLHERGGSQHLIHMHGELLKARCQRCGAIHDWDGDTGPETPCPACGKAPGLRPHIVWFGEMPLEMETIYAALDHCGLFVSIGTSGNVYPAAGFVQAIRPDAQSIELNLEPSLVRSNFKESRQGRATELVPAFVEEILSQVG